MTDGRPVAVEMKEHMVVAIMAKRGCSLALLIELLARNGQLHHPRRLAVVETVTKSFAGTSDAVARRLRRPRSPTISDGKKRALGIGHKRILVQRTLLTKAALGNGRNVDVVIGCRGAHCTAAGASGPSLSRLMRATARASCAFR